MSEAKTKRELTQEEEKNKENTKR